jgi:hypothetical protein
VVFPKVVKKIPGQRLLVKLRISPEKMQIKVFGNDNAATKHDLSVQWLSQHRSSGPPEEVMDCIKTL